MLFHLWFTAGPDTVLGADPPAGPHVLWYCFDGKPYKAPNACLGLWPYTMNPAPNPDNPSLYEYHDNITRHWAQAFEGLPVQWWVNVPAGWAPPTPGNPGPSVFSLLPSWHPLVNTVYTLQDFKDDVQATLGKFASVPTAGISFQFMGYDNTVDYDAAPAMSIASQFVWPSTCGGPTGNGKNEFIFLRTASVIGSGSVVSMLVDPDTGKIIEADVIFEATAGGAWPPPTAIPPFPGGPRYTTAILHEVGHFLGLDHSNLHPGITLPSFGLQPTPLAGSGAPATRMLYMHPGQLPGMVSFITALQFNHVAQALHADEAAAISEVYPVSQPSVVTGRVPTENVYGILQGVVVTASGGRGFGWNVYVLPHTPGSSVPTPRDPPVGVICGTTRLGPTSVVGPLNTNTVPPTPTTGDFRILVPPGIWDVFLEPCESIGIRLVPVMGSISGGPRGEWWWHQYLNAAGNPSTPFSGATSCAVVSDDTSAGLPPSPVSSLTFNAGSVVTLTLKETGTVAVEAVTRPAVSISPRNLHPLAQGQQHLIFQAGHNFGNISYNMTVNGVRISMGTPTAGGIPGYPCSSMWTLDAAQVLPPPGTPALIEVTVTEIGALPQGLARQPGVNRVQY